MARKLTANWVDLDFYKPNFANCKEALSWDYAYEELMNLQAKGTIPPISMIVDSGRGMWALWLVRQAEVNSPVDAFAENIKAWSDIQVALQHKLAYLGADSGAVDSSRVFRVLGSVNV